MIIECENCNKKFDIDQNLIPEKGRLLLCSSCNHKWFFKKITAVKIKELPINESMEIYYWDKENNSVWFLNYNDYFGSPTSLQMTLLNFERKKLFHQSMYNVTPVSGEYFKDKSPFSNSTYDCYILE